MIHNIKVSDNELFLLNGKCSPENQKLIDDVRQRQLIEKRYSITDKEADFILRVINETKTNLKLVYFYKQIDDCKICGKSGHYATYPRTTRYHRKGDTDLKHFIGIGQGIELSDSFVSIQGRVSLGGCQQCVTKLMPIIQDVIKDIRAEISGKITGEHPKYKRVARRKCKNCGWEGHEGEMGKLPTLMGDGYYPGICPKCNVSDRPFLFSHFEFLSGYEVIEINKVDNK